MVSGTDLPTRLDLADANLTAEVRTVLALFAANQRYDESLTPTERRALHEQAFMPLGLPAMQRVDVGEMRLPGEAGPLRARLYRPFGRRDRLPVLLHFHGGGMTVGSLEQYDSLCQRLCERSGVAVLTIDYRLAPEHPFPAALDDAWFALRWLHANGAALGLDVDRMAVGGDSAGGNLAAVLALMARDHGGPPIAFQLLVYPAVGTLGNSRSTDAFATGYLFEKVHLDTVYAQYLPIPEMIDDWRVSPIRAATFGNLPPAFVLSAEYEIMRDDIEDYARLLREAGNSVAFERYPGMIHPFLSLAGTIPEGAAAIDDCADRLAVALATDC
jgi:acetyl esterase